MSALKRLRGRPARTILGVIRLINGSFALLLPRRFTKMFGIDPEENGAAIYLLRLFGVRTVYIGLQLLTADGEELDGAVRDAPWIHASDTTAAAIAGLRGQLPRRAAAAGFVASSLNTALAFLARE